MFLKQTKLSVNERKRNLVASGLMWPYCNFHFYAFNSKIHTGFNLLGVKDENKGEKATMRSNYIGAEMCVGIFVQVIIKTMLIEFCGICVSMNIVGSFKNSQTDM